MRLFVAIEVPDDVRAGLDTLVAPLRTRHGHLRWSAAGTWHLTLAFLGEVDEDAAARAVDATDAVAAAASPVEVELARAGRFGRGVLWLGLTDAAYAALVSLGNRLRAALDDAGVDHDRKPLHPHLTLARARRDGGAGISRSRVGEVDEAVAALPDRLRAWLAADVVVVRSELAAAGARHGVVHRATLGG